MPSSFTAFDITKPASSQTGPVAIASANTNDLALAVGIMQGAFPGFTLAATTGTGTAAQPQYWTWTNGVYKLRVTNTWGVAAGALNNLTNQVYEWSTDTGGTWAAVDTATYTYDASGNMTASTGAGGMMGVLLQVIGKITVNLATFTTHAALTTTAHGTGTMALQNATAVAITGGTIKSTPKGTSTAADCSIDHAVSIREIHSAVAFVTTTMALDLSTAGSFSTTATGTGAQALTLTNAPASGVSHSFLFELTNGGLRTWTWPTGTKWAAGTAPTLSSSGKDVISFWTRDGGSTWNAGLFGKGFA